MTSPPADVPKATKIDSSMLSEDEVVDGGADGKASGNGTTTPKKIGWSRYNELRSKNKRRRHCDNR